VRRYRIHYSLAGNPEGGPAVKTGKVLVNGVPFQHFSFDTTGKTKAEMGYVRNSFVASIRGAAPTLTFVSTTSPAGHGPVIDDVSVEACLPGSHLCDLAGSR
jgi:hypothetical protein